MVLRKASDGLNHPPSPHSQPSDISSWPNAADHLSVDTADVPPVPSYRTREAARGLPKQTSYEPVGNPWLEQNRQGQNKSILPVLQHTHQNQPHMQDGSGIGHEATRDPNANQSEDHTPRSSSDSGNSRNFWDDDEEDAANGKVEPGQLASTPPHEPSVWQHEQNTHDYLSEAHTIKRKPLSSPIQGDAVDDIAANTGVFSSNNPYRSESSAADVFSSIPQTSAPQWDEEDSQTRSKAKEPLRNAMAMHTSFENPLQNDYSRWDSTFEGERADFHPSQNKRPPHPTTPPPPVPVPPSLFSSQPPDVPTSSEHDNDRNPWAFEAAIASKPHQSAPSSQNFTPQIASYNHSMLDRGQDTAVVSLEDELTALPNAAEPESEIDGDLIDFGAEARGQTLPMRTLSNNEGAVPPNETSFAPVEPEGDYFATSCGPPRKRHPTTVAETSTSNSRKDEYEPPEGPPPAKPPRPALVVESSPGLTKMIEQRNETYQIKHFNWFDHQSGRLRASSMLTQNQNGPCPLLALVNALILWFRGDSRATLDNALRAREQVTLGLIIDTLMDELLSGTHEDLPDVDELNRFLTMLHTGMNANPKFVDSPGSAPNLIDARSSIVSQARSQKMQPGSFEATQAIRLYASFAVPLIHGWIPSRQDSAQQAFTRSAQTYEDAQAVQFGEEELEYKLRNGGLSEEEQNVWQDIVAIKHFFRQYPTQLTPYGLDVIREWMLPGQFAILFRNDHFSTIYKHPDSGELFTLITDAGYAERDEIIWESLIDDSGQSDFFSGDFMSVSHSERHQSAPDPATDGRPQYLAPPHSNNAPPLSPQEQQEQHDADFAMALHLQEEEEQRVNSNRRRSGGQSQPQGQGIPISLRQRSEQNEARPHIPPRTSRSQNTAVNRSADIDADDTPPTYEEAAKGKPYIPPLGSPLHPSSDPSPRTSTTQLSQTLSTASNRAQESNSAPAPRRQQRRTSAYGENAMRYGPASPSLSRPSGHAYGVGVGPGYADNSGPARTLKRRGDSAGDRECVIM